MGEKFDSQIEWGAQPGHPQFGDPTGPGFPAPQYAQMAGGGAGWRQAFGAYDQRSVDDVVKMCGDARDRLARAANDEGSRLAALQGVDNRLTAGLRDLQLHGNQSEMTLQMLSREGTIPTPELEDEARASAKRLTKAVSDEVGPLQAFLNDFISGLRSRALDAAGTRVEEAVNRIGELAYGKSALLYRKIRERGQTQPDGGAPPPVEATA
jgi:hypothetical protein